MGGGELVMNRMKNNEGITQFHFKTRVVYYCEIGDDYSVGGVDVVIRNPAYYCDYDDIVDYFNNTLHGKPSTHEKVCRTAIEFFKKTFEPEHIMLNITTKRGELDCIETIIEE